MRDEEIIIRDTDNMGSNEPGPHYSGDFRLGLNSIPHIIVRIQTTLELEIAKGSVLFLRSDVLCLIMLNVFRIQR